MINEFAGTLNKSGDGSARLIFVRRNSTSPVCGIAMTCEKHNLQVRRNPAFIENLNGPVFPILPAGIVLEVFSPVAESPSIWRVPRDSVFGAGAGTVGLFAT
jgi:hypothetical protein